MVPGRPPSAEENEILRGLLTCFAQRAMLSCDAVIALVAEVGQVPSLPPETAARLAGILNGYVTGAARLDSQERPYLARYGLLTWKAAGGPANQIKL